MATRGLQGSRQADSLVSSLLREAALWCGLVESHVQLSVGPSVHICVCARVSV